MAQLNRQRIRLRVDTATFDQMLDVRTGEAPVLWRGNDVQFEIGLHRGDTLLEVGNYASMTLEVKTNTAAGLGAAPLMTATITAPDDTLTDATWTDESAQHALFTFTGDETNLALGDGQSEATYWLVVSGLTSDSPARRVTFGHTLLKIREDGAGTAGTPPTLDPLYLTQAETETLLGAKLAKANNLSDVADAATARANLGLGDMAQEDVADWLPDPPLSGYLRPAPDAGNPDIALTADAALLIFAVPSGGNRGVVLPELATVPDGWNRVITHDGSAHLVPITTHASDGGSELAGLFYLESATVTRVNGAWQVRKAAVAKEAEVTGDVTLEGENLVRVTDTSGGGVTVTLPPAVYWLHAQVTIWSEDASNAVTVAADAGDTLRNWTDLTTAFAKRELVAVTDTLINAN